MRSLRADRGRKAAYAACALLVLAGVQQAATGNDRVRLSGHVAATRMARVRHLGRKPSSETMQLAVALQLRDKEGLDRFLSELANPRSPEFRKFLTPEQFADRFGPSVDEVNSIAKYFETQGLRVKKIHKNRLLIDLEGSAADVESALRLEMHRFQDLDGRVVDAAIDDPQVSAEVSPRIATIAGLNGFFHAHHHLQKPKRAAGAAPRAQNPRLVAGCGVDYIAADGLSPTQINTAYNITPIAKTGTGQSLALFELDGFTAGDITCYENTFTLPALVPTVVAVDAFNTLPADGSDEVTLDIELALAVAPGLASMRVYEGPNTDVGVLHTYAQIANDNLSGLVSSSWGAAEDTDTQSFFDAEQAIFAQMATQGQSFFAAAGDNGAFDNGNEATTLQVDDPASQIYATAVGGTSLTLGAGNSYGSETVWNNGAGSGAGGGGISSVWAIPYWQVGISTTANLSLTARMVPDISLEADPNKGYAVYYTDGAGNTDCTDIVGSSPCWLTFGGTSASAPLWAAMTAIINQGKGARMGFLNPYIYTVAEGANYATDFHDVTSGTNLYYPAKTGFDLATGWGTFNGLNFYTDVKSASLPATPATPTGVAVEVVP